MSENFSRFSDNFSSFSCKLIRDHMHTQKPEKPRQKQQSAAGQQGTPHTHCASPTRAPSACLVPSA
eukprot:7299899-Prymnesium_polylepis.1